MMPLNMILHYTYIFYSNHQNMQNLRDCTVPNDVSLIWCCYQARETTKHLMEINNLASKWLALNGKTPAPEPSHCALLEENITVNSFLAFQTNYIQFFSTQFYPFFPLPLSINQCLFVVNNPTEFQSDNGCKQSHRVTYKADPKTDQ